MSADTIVPDKQEPQSWNRYSYVKNSPLNYTDPSGHLFCRVGEGQCQNRISFEPVDMGNTGSKAWDWVRNTVGNIACGIIGSWCKVEDNVLQPTTDAEYSEAHMGDVMGLATMLTVPSGALTTTTKNVFAVGGGPNGPRPHPLPRVGKDVFPDANGMLNPQNLPFPNGQSTFSDIVESGLSPGSPYYRLPAGTTLPNGLAVVEDGVDVIAGSSHPKTHHTIFNTVPMHVDDFIRHIKNLGWEYVDKIR